MSAPSLELRKAYDTLATGKDLSEAIHMACGYIEDDRQKTAIQAVVDCLQNVLGSVLTSIEEVMEELK